MFSYKHTNMKVFILICLILKNFEQIFLPFEDLQKKYFK